MGQEQRKILFPFRPHSRQTSWDRSSCDGLLQLCEYAECHVHAEFSTWASNAHQLVTRNGDYVRLRKQLLRRHSFTAPPIPPEHTLNAPEQHSADGFQWDGPTPLALGQLLLIGLTHTVTQLLTQPPSLALPPSLSCPRLWHVTKYSRAIKENGKPFEIWDTQLNINFSVIELQRRKIS